MGFFDDSKTLESLAEDWCTAGVVKMYEYDEKGNRVQNNIAFFDSEEQATEVVNNKLEKLKNNNVQFYVDQNGVVNILKGKSGVVQVDISTSYMTKDEYEDLKKIHKANKKLLLEAF